MSLTSTPGACRHIAWIARERLVHVDEPTVVRCYSGGSIAVRTCRIDKVGRIARERLVHVDEPTVVRCYSGGSVHIAAGAGL